MWIHILKQLIFSYIATVILTFTVASLYETDFLAVIPYFIVCFFGYYTTYNSSKKYPKNYIIFSILYIAIPIFYFLLPYINPYIFFNSITTILKDLFIIIFLLSIIYLISLYGGYRGKMKALKINNINI